MPNEPRPIWQWIVIVFLIIGAFAYIGASWFFSEVMLNFDTKTLAEDKARLTITRFADYGLQNVQELRVKANGVSLAAWYTAGTADCGVLLLHGHTGTRYGTFAYAPMFTDRGCHLMMFDARKHGDSTGRFGTYGFHEQKDTLAVLERFKALSALRNDQIGLLGESYGAATALLAAQNVPDLAFVIAESPYKDLRSIIREQGTLQFGDILRPLFPGAFLMSELRAGIETDDISPLNAVPRINAPILLQHAKEDAYTFAEHSEHIFANSDKSKTMIYISDWGAGHAGAIYKNSEGYAQVVDEFLAAFVPSFPAR